MLAYSVYSGLWKGEQHDLLLQRCRADGRQAKEAAAVTVTAAAAAAVDRGVKTPALCIADSRQQRLSIKFWRACLGNLGQAGSEVSAGLTADTKFKAPASNTHA